MFLLVKNMAERPRRPQGQHYLRGWGYSLYSDGRDDRRIFQGLKLAIWHFLGAVQAKSIKK